MDFIIVFLLKGYMEKYQSMVYNYFVSVFHATCLCKKG